MKFALSTDIATSSKIRYLERTRPSAPLLGTEPSTDKELLKIEMKMHAYDGMLKNMLKTLDEIERNRDINEIKTSIYHMKKTLAQHLDSDQRWTSFQEHFDLVQSDFYKRLKSDYDNLTLVDLELCAYLRMEMNTKDIAQHLNLSIRGIETRKYRLKKKLDLEKNQDLNDFISTY